MDYVGMTNCFYCNEPFGVVLDRRLRKTLPREIGPIDMEPCPKCKDWMSKGIILISIKDDTTEDEMKGPLPNPYRTGGWAVIKKKALEKVIAGEMLEFALKYRFLFICDSAWKELRLHESHKKRDENDS